MTYLETLLRDIQTGKKSPLQALTGDKPVKIELAPETKTTIITAVSILAAGLITAAVINRNNPKQ